MGQKITNSLVCVENVVCVSVAFSILTAVEPVFIADVECRKEQKATKIGKKL